MTYEELVAKVARMLAVFDGLNQDAAFAYDPPAWHLYKIPAKTLIFIIAVALREQTADAIWHAMLADSPLFPKES